MRLGLPVFASQCGLIQSLGSLCHCTSSGNVITANDECHNLATAPSFVISLSLLFVIGLSWFHMASSLSKKSYPPRPQGWFDHYQYQTVFFIMYYRVIKKVLVVSQATILTFLDLATILVYARMLISQLCRSLYAKAVLQFISASLISESLILC